MTHAAWRGPPAARSRPMALKCSNGRWPRPTSTFWTTSRSCAAITRTVPDIVRAHTGARIVKAFDHNVRSATGKLSGRRIAGGQQVQRPAHVVHGDYTLTSGPQRLRDLANPPTVNDTYRTQLADGETLLDEADVTRALGAGRFALINLWRNIADEPVATNPLALCDAASVHPDDLVVFEIHYADRIGENYFAKHADAHRWYFYPALTRDEALLIKQWGFGGRPRALRRRGGRRDEPRYALHIQLPHRLRGSEDGARRARSLEHRGALYRALRLARVRL